MAAAHPRPRSERTCRASDASFYGWRKKFGGMTVSEAKRLRELEAENTKLKKLLAESMLNADALRTALSRKY